MKCTKLTIWNFAQNKPSLVVHDIITKYPVKLLEIKNGYKQ